MTVKINSLPMSKFKVSYRGYDSGAIYTSVVEARTAPEAAALVRSGADDCFEIIQVNKL